MYVKKPNFCDVCQADLSGTRKKRCNGCKLKLVCEECGKEFFRRVHYKKCGNCSYAEYRYKHPDSFERYRERTRVEYNKKLRVSHGLPEEHDFGKAPKGSGFVNVRGYRKFWVKDKETGKYISRYEHHLVMEEVLGRALHESERVHHKNGERSDNRPENLELWCIGQPPGQRVEDKIKYYIEYLSLHGYKVEKT